MFRTKIRIQDRILAMMLAVVVLFTAMPVNVYAGVSGYEDYYTIQVLDGESNPIEDATVTYTITGNGIDGLADVEETTNSDGVVQIDLATNYSDIISEDTPATLSYTVVKDGYTSGEKTDVAIADAKGSDEITLSVEVVSTVYTLVVKDGETPVEGATVTYSFSKKLADGNYETLVSDDDAVTGADGAISVDLAAHVDVFTNNEEVVLTYTVTKEGYITSEVTEENAIAVTAYNGETIIPFNAIQKHIVTINVTGDATVLVDGAPVALNYSVEVENGTQVAVEITAADGKILKSVKVNEAEKNVSEEQSYTETLTITEATTIEASVLDIYTISVTTNEDALGEDVVAGAITLMVNDEEATDYVIEEGAKVELVIKAASYDNCAYQIQSVKVGNEEKVTAGNVSELTVILENLTSDEIITVEYVRVYTVTIVGTNDPNGTITTNPAHTDGIVIVEETQDGKIRIEARPEETYRVSSVKINGVEDADESTKVKGENDEVYAKDLLANQNYTIEVAFALNRYSVTAEIADGQNGTITFEGDVADGYINHGGDTVVNVEPSAGYSIAKIEVEGAITEEVDVFTYENGVLIFTLSNVLEAKHVLVTLVETEKADTNYVTYEPSTEYIRNEDNIFIYAKDTTVTFRVNDENSIGISGIRVFETVNDGEVLVGGDDNTSEVTFTETKTISKVEVYYQADNAIHPAWHAVESVTVDDVSVEKVVIDKTLLEEDIKFTFDNKHANDYYNDSFHVTINATDAGDYSGIAKLEYWTVVDGVDSEVEEIIFDEIMASITETVEIEVVDSKNNSEAVVVWVKVTDRAGNEIEKLADTVRVNCTPPELISVKVTGTQKEDAENGYYTGRTATIRVKDRPESFNAESAKNGIVVTIGEQAISVPISDWKPVAGETGVYETTVTFAEDAEYYWEFTYINLAGKEMITTDATEEIGENIYEFVVDSTDPVAEIKTEETVWSKLLSTITFGVWKNYDVTVTVDATDDTAGVKEIFYYKTEAEESLLKVSELDDLYGDGKFTEDPYTISANNSGEKFVVYARVSDKAGNYMYISTDGIIVEDLTGTIELTPATEPNGYNIYNSDVDVAISVTENVENSSGIKEIAYKLYKNAKIDENQVVTGEITQQEILYSFDFVKNEDAVNQIGTLTVVDKSVGREAAVTQDCELTYDMLTKAWNGNITVDGKANSSDNVLLVVSVTDNAGNTYENSKWFAIDTDEIKAEISYLPTAENLNNNVAYMEANGSGYFGIEERVATLTITDRSFDSEAATNGITISATNGNKAPDNVVTLVEGTDYVISTWSAPTLNADGKVQQTATITFKTNANYTWSFAYTNKAGNVLDVANNLFTGDSVTPFTFTVDNKEPEGTISLNNNLWDELLNKITFGLYSKVRVEVTATYEDDTSPVIVEYFKTDNTTAMKREDLEACTFVPYEDFTIDTEDGDERFVVYLRITDYAGNVKYLSTNGFIFDDTQSTITLTPAVTENPKQPVNNIYNKNVNVKVELADAEPYSGIKTVDYWVVMDGDENHPTQSDNLFTFKIEQPTYEELVGTWEGVVPVEVNKNNSCDVEVFVKVVDNAGNEIIDSVPLDIDITSPAISVTYDNNDDNNGNGYFTDTRKATVVITERTHHFNADVATSGIKITAVNAKGEAIADAYTISNWTTVEGATPDAATHTATIEFTKDANYTWEISYADQAGNPNSVVNTGNSVAPFKFSIDRVAPTGIVTAVAEGVDKGAQKVTRTDKWNVLRTESFKFGFWANESITLSGEYSDITSTEIAKVEYFKDVVTETHAIMTPMTAGQLDAITTWTAFNTLKVETDEQFVVYLKITDLAGNYSYICTNGLLVDHEKPIEETIAPEITTTPITQPLNDIYREDVSVAVKVVEPIKGNTYSGLKEVGYKVLNMGNETQSGVLYTFGLTEPTSEELKNVWENETAIIVEAAKNNSNDVKIVVYAEDNAGNYSEKEVTIMIDITVPTIEVTYNNNTPDSERFFNADRTATIVITERNFNAEDVRVEITSTGESTPGISGWSKSEGSGNGDNTKWTGTITYSVDGDYTFNINYTDLAGLAATTPQYGGSVAPTDFVIDKTLPVVSVKYDNNVAENEKYFNATRTAEVQITEHNFDVERVEFDFDVNGDGGPQPSVEWREDGDNHIAVISYTADGDYEFNVVAVSDMAANSFETVDYGDSVAAQEFTVDTEIEAPVISNVENNKPYGYDEEIKPSVSVTDINYDRSEVHLYRTSMADIGVEVTDRYIEQIGGGENGGSKEYDIFKKDAEGKYDREMEGIYRLTATVWDKAGNESEVSEVVFSINRFGSVYVYDDYLIELIADGGAYKQEIEQELIITEYNATKLVEDSVEIEITKDGKPMENIIAPDIVELEPSADRGWYEYQYTISKDNFAAEGTYKIVVSSKDNANNTPENDMGILFRVDKEAPVFTRFSGLEAAIVDATELEIEYSVYDALGLKSITVKVNGKQIGEPITDFGDDINNYSGSVVLGESTDAQSVQFIVEDLSGRITDTDTEVFKAKYSEDYNKEFISSVTVTTNAFVRFYANKPLFWGTIGGGTATVAAAGAAIAFFRKRKLKLASK